MTGSPMDRRRFVKSTSVLGGALAFGLPALAEAFTADGVLAAHELDDPDLPQGVPQVAQERLDGRLVGVLECPQASASWSSA